MEIRWPRRRWVPYLVFVLGLACTAGVCLQIARVQHARERERFGRAVLKTGAEIQGRMDTYIAMLRATTGLFAASDYVSHDEFQRFIDRLELQAAYPGIQGIGYSERAADNAPLAARLAREYAQNIPVRSPADAPEHHAIIFVQPFDDVNRAAIGYDMFADTALREAMELARDGARPVASALVQLHGADAADRRGFLIYVHFYATPDAPDSLDVRRRDLVGFIYASFRADDLFGTVFAESNSLAEFALYDSPITDPDALLFASPRFSSPTDPSPLRATTTITVAERMWTASLLPGENFAAGRAPGVIPLVATAGALVSLLLLTLVRAQTRAAERFQQQAHSLRESQQELADSEARKGAILESALDAIITIDHHGQIMEWNPAAERIFGWPRADAVGRSLNDLITPRHDGSPRTDALWNIVGPAPGQAIGIRVETTARRADGSEFPAEVSICRIGSSEPARFTGFIRDITERVRAEHHRDLMTRELDHRVKNNLATVLAILGESGRRCGSVTDVVRSVSGRLRALAGLHEMLAARRWQGAELGELVSRTLAPHRLPPPPTDPASSSPVSPSLHADDRARVTIAGPPVTLSGKIASAVCMALHELATNASKYGSLSTPAGHVDICWRLDHDDANVELLILTWRERGGPTVHPPAQRGFGSELIEGGIAFETGGVSTMSFDPDGIACVLRIPLHPSDAVEAELSPPPRSSSSLA